MIRLDLQLYSLGQQRQGKHDVQINTTKPQKALGQQLKNPIRQTFQGSIQAGPEPVKEGRPHSELCIRFWSVQLKVNTNQPQHMEREKSVIIT